MPRCRAYSATRPGQDPPCTAGPYGVSHSKNVHSGRLMCIPTMPLLHWTQLPSGFLNQSRYSAGSSIKAACLMAGDSALACGRVELAMFAISKAIVTVKRVDSMELQLLEMC